MYRYHWELYYIKIYNIYKHFDDKYLEYLYNEEQFKRIHAEFIHWGFQRILQQLSEQKHSHYILLIYITLNPIGVLSKLVMYEMDFEFSRTILFQKCVFASFMRKYYNLKMNRYKVLAYILRNIILQQRVILYAQFKQFMNNVLSYKMMTADNVVNQLYIPYLLNNVDMLCWHVQPT